VTGNERVLEICGHVHLKVKVVPFRRQNVSTHCVKNINNLSGTNFEWVVVCNMDCEP
jgi:hypothetical protein